MKLFDLYTQRARAAANFENAMIGAKTRLIKQCLSGSMTAEQLYDGS